MYCVLFGVRLARCHWARCDVLSLVKLECSSKMASRAPVAHEPDLLV